MQQLGHGRAESLPKGGRGLQPLTHLHRPLPAQMLTSNIEVTSSITDSLQQKVYNMALEELEAFLGRSVEPLTPLPLLADPASPQPSTTGWWQRSATWPPVLIQASFFHGVQDGSHYPTHYPTSQWQDWKEPSELGGLWAAHAPPGAAGAPLLQAFVARRLPTVALSLCCSLREALVQRGKEHQQDRTIPKHYVPYLLAMLNNVLALR